MLPLTLERPKPLVEVAGLPLIAHAARALPKEVDEILIVVGYLGERIVSYCGEHLCGRPVRYIWQREPKGTAEALRLARDLLHDKFLVLFADDLLDASSLARLVQHDLALLAHEHPEPQHFGVMVLNDDGTLKDLIEKPDVPPSNLISTGVMVLDDRIFEYEAPLHTKGEYFLTDMVTQLAHDHAVQVERMEFWCPVGKPEDIAVAEAALALRNPQTPVRGSDLAPS
jgi:NDP-sugar pyrophosphorylase family protein